MIELSNKHRLEFVAAAGALGFDGRGWPWEWPLRWLGLIDPKLFTITTKTLLPKPWKGNFQWYAPWRVLKFVSLKGETIHPLLAMLKPSMAAGVVNAFGLPGPGIGLWRDRIYPIIESLNYKVIVSITAEFIWNCLEMAKQLNGLQNVVGIELNVSCPNTNFSFLDAKAIKRICRRLREASNHPLLLKLGYNQPYCQIAKETEGFVEAIAINTVPWQVIFPNRRSPQRRSPLEKYGGGGVSGPIIRPFTWKMVKELRKAAKTPIIGPTIWTIEDMLMLETIGASAWQFGTIFLFYPWKPTSFVKRWRRN